MEVYTIHFDSIDSTSTFAKQHIADFDQEKLTCITADIQTSGYGRQNRTWVSKKGNLMMTLVFFLPPSDKSIPNLAQILTYSVAKVLSQEITLEIKWPNDLLANDKKLAGALVETIPTNSHVAVILGLGLNVNTSVKTSQETTSLQELTQKNWDLHLLRDKIIARFQKDRALGFVNIYEDFLSLLAYRNKRVQVQTPSKEIIGTIDSITNEGYLCIKLPDGKIESIVSGEIKHLRPI